MSVELDVKRSVSEDCLSEVSVGDSIRNTVRQRLVKQFERKASGDSD